MKRKITAWTGGLGGLGLLGWALFNIVQMSRGSAPMTQENANSTMALFSAAIGSFAIAGATLWAQHFALVLLAATCIDDADSMTLVQQLAARLKGKETPKP